MIGTKISAKQAAAILGCSRSYLYALMVNGLLVPVEQDTVVPHPRLQFDEDAVIELRAKLMERKERLAREAKARQHPAEE